MLLHLQANHRTRRTNIAADRAERQREAQEDALSNVFDSAIAQLTCVTLVFETAARAIFFHTQRWSNMEGLSGSHCGPP